MKNNYKKILSAIATGALLFNSVGAVFAETTSLVISGNGAGSDNTTQVVVQNSTQVVQTNTANITNNVEASSSTGSNSANRNTSGSVTIDTGDASTGVAVSNTANSNVAQVSGCCAVDASVEVSGNGADSRNNADLTLGTNTEVFQTNVANIRNDVNADAVTGDNRASRNTGGDVMVTTGDADTTVLVDNSVNSNVARIGDTGTAAGSVSLMVMGNGADSRNNVDLTLGRSLSLLQDNYADVRNDVDADAVTGFNDANRNTGGDALIDTGDASTGVAVDNMANFNVADLDCGCLLDVLAKVSGNGADSRNEIAAELVDDRLAFQTNDYSCDDQGTVYGLEILGRKHREGCNEVNADAVSGDNNLRESTGEVEGDPSVMTGTADTLVDVSNSANSNVLTDEGTMTMPTFDFNFDFGTNFGFLWTWFHGMTL